MNIKDLKKMLYNRKCMQKHVEKFTNGANDVDGDLTKFHKDMLESIVDSYEINTAKEQNLTLTSSHLERMILDGNKMMDYYQFFM